MGWEIFWELLGGRDTRAVRLAQPLVRIRLLPLHHGEAFRGQGTQHVGMGKDIAIEFAEARRTFEEVDAALSTFLSRMMWDGFQDDLTMTANAQPAILAHSLAVLRVLQKELGWSDLPPSCGFTFGHSLGEFSALCASRAISLADAARLVRERGEAMQEAVRECNGAMVALIGNIDVETADEIARGAAIDTKRVCQVANINSPLQIVLSGHAAAIDRAIEIAKEPTYKNKVRKTQLLQVSAPFHCSLMQPARQRFSEFVRHRTNDPRIPGFIQFNDPIVPVISNVTAQPLSSGQSIVMEIEEQVTSPVQWMKSVRCAGGLGVEEFWEVGPGRTLSSFIGQIDRKFVTRQFGTAAELVTFCKAFSGLSD